MGSFGGHALPGSFLIIIALWHTVQLFRHYYQSLRKGGPPFRATVTYPFSCWPRCVKNPSIRNWQWEGALKILFTSVGFTGEIITAYKNGQFVHLGNGQHATMFFFFGLSGITDILMHHKVPIPKDMDYLIATLAFIVEGVLFKFHLHGRTSLDVLIHTLLLYTVYATVLTLLTEMRFRQSPLAVLARCFFLLVQGTWFWQLGFILYNPFTVAESWDKEDHDQMMVATMMFAWHMAADVIFMLLIGAVIGCMYKTQESPSQFDAEAKIQLLPREAQGNCAIQFHDDDESDIEIEQSFSSHR